MGLQAIICGDSLKVLGTLKSGTVDICLTDPPFNVGLRYKPNPKNKRQRKNAWDDKRPEKEYWTWFKRIFTEVYRVMRPGYLFMSHSDRGIYTAKPILEQIGFNFTQNIIWWGPNGFNTHNSNRYWSLRHEIILFMHKEDPPYMIHKKPGLWYTSVIKAARPQQNYKEKRMHPAQKPVKLYYTLLARTPGQTVLDPFSGGGTTARACRALGKDYIVIDKYKEYCKLAQQDIPWKK